MLQTGDPAPEFTLPSFGPEGRVEWTLSAHRGRPGVLLFFDFVNAPLARALLEGMRDAEIRWRELGAYSIAISTDHLHAQRLQADASFLRFPLLSDARDEVSRAYGVWEENRSLLGGSAARPTFFVLDASGAIHAARDLSDRDPARELRSVEDVLSTL